MIVIGITGSIACYKSCYIVNQLVKDKFDVTVAMTDSAMKFISPIIFRSLTGNPVIHNIFGEGQSLYAVPHIDVSEKAEVIAIVPATANIIGKIASGICDDILTCLVISAKCPILIAPAMHENMYLNKAVQGNIQKLKDRNLDIIAPVKGHLVSGHRGIGHLASEETILNEIKKHT